MDDSSLFIYSVVVFSLMFIGLILTAIEFRYGAPSRQAKEASKKLATEKVAREGAE